MSGPVAASAVLFIVAAVLVLPSVVDRARRNAVARRLRAERADAWHSFWLDSSEPVEPWADDPTPTYDALCWELWESEMRGAS